MYKIRKRLAEWKCEVNTWVINRSLLIEKHRQYRSRRDSLELAMLRLVRRLIKLLPTTAQRRK